MSVSFNNLYEFGEFCLDTREKILMQGDQPVELTPKGFELLSVFVENHGRLLEKDELMDKIWADSFVEESNLTFNIRQLRKILGDDAHAPRYIKTVRRHGYRFIAPVRQISIEKFRVEETEAKLEIFTPPVSQMPEIKSAPMTHDLSVVKLNKRKFFPPVIVVAAALLIAVTVSGWQYFRNKVVESSAPVLAAPFASEKLSTNGKVFNAVLSPDGNNVVYTNETAPDKTSVWLRQLEDGSNVEIIPPSDDAYRGFAFSPDGKTIYFVRGRRQAGEKGTIYRISIFGGVPHKIISNAEGCLSLSPDGRRISFVRRPQLDDENYSLWIADSADGSSERKLAARPRPFRIGDNRISPDGKRVVFAVGQSENAANEFGLAMLDLETGEEREFSKERFFNIKNLAWLPDGSGLLVTASRVPNRNFRIWQISATGEAVPLTKDSEHYGLLSLDKNAAQIVATQIKHDFRVRLFNLENPTENRVLAFASTASFAPDGKIYFSSSMTGNEEIWSINADGSSQRQLTNNPADEALPIPLPDGKTLLFVSNRTGAAHVWRMNTDGSNQTQITRQEGGFPITVSPDGEWIYYHHGINRTLWRVSVKTGEEQLVLNKTATRFAVSRDGSQIVYPELQGDDRVLTVASLADGQTLKTFRLADAKSLVTEVVWMPDGKNLAYVTSNRSYENYVFWLQPLDGGAPRQIAFLGDEETSGTALSVSPDGKMFSVVQGRWLHDAVLLKGLR